MRRDIQSNQRRIRVLNFEVTGTGTAVIVSGSDEATLTDSGTGDYIVTFKRPAKRAITAQVTSKTAALFGAVTALTNLAATIKTYDASGAATDAAFYLTVTLADA